MYHHSVCTDCHPRGPFADPRRYSLKETEWGVEILLDHAPVYSFVGDMNFRLNSAEVRIALACVEVLDRFARGEDFEPGWFSFTGGEPDGLFREPGDFPHPYLRFDVFESDKKLRVGRHKAWAICAVQLQLREWVTTAHCAAAS